MCQAGQGADRQLRGKTQGMTHVLEIAFVDVVEVTGEELHVDSPKLIKCILD